MDDLISRQHAIVALKSRKTAEQSSAGVMRNAVVDFCIGIIKKLPSVQPEHKTGRWIPTYEDCCADVWVKWKCSECGYVRKKGWKQTYDGAKPDALFCEMCNADMRGEQDG